MQRDQDLTWAQVAMAANAPMLTKAAMVDGHPEVGILPTGQAVGAIDELPTVAELLGDRSSATPRRSRPTCATPPAPARTAAARLMDLTWSCRSEQAFRAEARTWLEANVPTPALPSGDTAEGFALHLEWERALFEARLRRRLVARRSSAGATRRCGSG